ncbi:tyrosine-type recombinase/integrase [Lunatimonas salinarum]|uniref:tyrosine-type recombinase/integrase n=1 Tax=Lunatimonas salinarum TaxID=1774590 RepID=UPI001AE0D0CC|nr:tyrosine-type recombinase/integrase [Lunatimonas salinarum]
MLFSFLNHLEFEKRYSEHTLSAYRRDLTQFEDFLKGAFGLEDPSEAGHSEIRAWMVDLIEQGLAATTVNRKMATLKSFYKFLHRSGEIQQNPTYKVRSLKKPRRLPAFIQETAIDKVLDEWVYSEDFEGQRDRMVIEFLYLTGVRLSELIGLRWMDLDLQKGEVKVMGKGRKYRIIPLSKSILENIIRYQKLFKETFSNVEESDYFIVRNTREPAYPMLIYRIVRNQLDLFVQTSKRSPHVLRHTFATHLLNKGADLNAVKDLLGHASLAATQVYTHNSIEKLKAVFEQAHPKA